MVSQILRAPLDIGLPLVVLLVVLVVLLVVLVVLLVVLVVPVIVINKTSSDFGMTADHSLLSSLSLADHGMVP